MAEVLIGCKLSNGLILEIVKPGLGRNPGPRGRTVTLKGANSLRVKGVTAADGQHGYAVTPVDKAFWDEWFKANKELEFVRNGFVFVAQNLGEAKGIAKERIEERTGLEALAQENDPRTRGVAPDPDVLKRVAAPMEQDAS